MTLVPGDPASISVLGSDLVRQADQLREHRDDLTRVRASLSGWEGPAAYAFDTSFAAQVRAVDDAADALAEGGRALQGYAVDLQHARALASEAEQFVAAHGLHLDDTRVRMPWGAYSVEEAHVLRAARARGAAAGRPGAGRARRGRPRAAAAHRGPHRVAAPDAAAGRGRRRDRPGRGHPALTGPLI